MKSPVQNRSLFVCLVLVAGFSALSVRLVFLQWLHGGEDMRQARISLEHTEVVPARFGLIVDRNEDIIARNLPLTTIVADREHLHTVAIAARGVAYAQASRQEEWTDATEKERARLVSKERRKLLEMDRDGLIDHYINLVVSVLAPELRMSRNELKDQLIAKKKGDVILAKNLRDDQADPVERQLKKYHIQGLRFQKKMGRWYSTSDLATHTIGFVNHEGIGQRGVELFMKEDLVGTNGSRTLKRNSRGLLIPVGGETLQVPEDGDNVQTALDLTLQEIAEQELDWGLAEFESRCGAVIIMEPKTGDVLAIASRPHFNLNLREGYRDAHFHYAVEGLYEPGSTFKVVAAGGAIDAGIVSPNTPIECGWGKRHIMGKYYVWDHHPYGTLSVSEVLMKSSNTGAYEIALRLGRTRFVDYLNRFGFIKPTGIELTETRGMLADPSNPINFSRMAYGYSVAVTPLQMCSAYVAIANGGMLMRPRLVQAVVGNDGTIVKEFPPQEIGRVMRESSATKLREALTTVVSLKGTAKRAAVPGQKVAGKTGTADKLLPSGRGYYRDRNVVSFVGMLPADNPAFVCAVVIDDPQTTKVQRYGGTIAAPIFARIGTRAVEYLGIPPTEPIEEEKGALAAAGSN